MGAAKGLGVAQIPRLTQAIDGHLGVLWLLAAALLVATAVSLYAWPQWWWAVGAGALVVLQAAIVTSWADARYGTIANGILLAGVTLGFMSQAPWSFVADGRGALTADGKSFTRMRWSTPLGRYRQFGSHRLMARGEGIWHAPAGDYSYLRFHLDAIEYNVAGTRP